MRRGLATAVLFAALAAPAAAQDVPGVVGEGAREQSCRALAAGTVGATDQATAGNEQAVDPTPATGLPATWPQAPAALKLPLEFPLRTSHETFNRLYEFVTRNGEIYARPRADGTSAWRELPLPPCFDGRVSAISADDDEMIALDDARRIYTMDNALKGGALFNWTSRWGTPFWAGPGYTLPRDVLAWSWSVISPAEDKRWTDPAGNHTAVGNSKVSHIWSLRRGGQRITFNDPWLPLDDSYEVCGPVRGRFRAINLSASGSFLFVIGSRGDMFTRIYDFDLSGHDTLFFKYSYENQRGKGDGAPIQLPAAPWVRQPKIPGAITSQISIHKVGVDAVHRILRVEGRRGTHTGYWERDVAMPASAGWTFHATGLELSRPMLANPRWDTSRQGLGRSPDRSYTMASPLHAVMADFSAYCSPSHIRVTENGRTRTLLLYHVDGLRQQARAAGLDDNPREENGAIEDHGKFTSVTIEATRHEVRIAPLGWVFER